MKWIACLDLRFLTELVVDAEGRASSANYKCLLFCANEGTEHSQEAALQKYICTAVYQSVSAKVGCLLQMEITRAVKGKAKQSCGP